MKFKFAWQFIAFLAKTTPKARMGRSFHKGIKFTQYTYFY